MANGAETCTFTKQAHNKPVAAHTKSERRMLNIPYKDRRTNIWVMDGTTVIYIISNVRKNKLVLGRAHQPPQKRQMDFACHHSESLSLGLLIGKK